MGSEASDDRAAVPGTYVGHATLADGTIRVKVDIDPPSAKAFLSSFQSVPLPVALALLTKAAAMDADRRATMPTWRNLLHTHGFFHSRELWKVVGGEDYFHDWLRQQPSAASGKADYVDGEARCEVAHVRTAANSGTGMKPAFSAIPLTHAEHRQQHQRGEASLLLKKPGTELAEEYAARWAEQMLKRHLNIESLADIALPDFLASMDTLGLANYLPTAVLNA